MGSTSFDAKNPVQPEEKEQYRMSTACVLNL